VLAEGLHDPRAMVIAGDQAFWIDGGTCTDGAGGCVGNRDGALRRILVSGGAAITQSSGHGSVGGLAVSDGDVYFCASGEVWRAHGIFTDSLDVGRGCEALAVGDGELFLATFDAVVRVPR